jgi:hypothetical protein
MASPPKHKYLERTRGRTRVGQLCSRCFVQRKEFRRFAPAKAPAALTKLEFVIHRHPVMREVCKSNNKTYGHGGNVKLWLINDVVSGDTSFDVASEGYSLLLGTGCTGDLG